jgi:hypothetical protein
MARLALPGESSTAADVLARAFAADPVLEPVLRHRRDVVAALRRYFEIEVELAFAGRGEAWLDDELQGATLWHRPGAWPAAAHAPLSAILGYARVFTRRFVTASRVAETLARSHPHEPHWYLLFIGVVPEATGSGKGAELLRPPLARCDEEGVPAYLEATSDASARLFGRFGFETLEELVLPTGVAVRRMWRSVT